MRCLVPPLPRRRRGFSAIELVIALPVLMMLLMGLLEFSLLFYARTQLVEASRVGARAASFQGVQPTEVELQIRQVLNPRLQTAVEVSVTPAAQSGEPVVVGVSLPMNAAAPDLLWPIGYSLRNQQLHAETRMIKE